MNIKQIIFISVLAIGHSLCFAQGDLFKNESGAQKFNSNDSIYFVMKVDDRSLEFDPRGNEKFDFASLDPNTIQSISILKGEEAKNNYGNRAQHGVVIVTFKDFDMISKELQKKFTDLNKK
jgi:hypothetical protein